ncbi:MAG: hypothetical protein SV253_01870 [Halobacteria archaeon]|nr:hypothetical protein [Halobacteria archaeon]
MLAIALGGAALALVVIAGAYTYRNLSTEVVTCDGCGTDIVDPDKTTVCTVCDTPLFEEGEDYMQYGAGGSSSSGTETNATNTETGTETERIEL